ncbi:MAG TPA: hypothetical protein VJP80_01030 [Candidatus Saccharimonadales bacterium]|nr:hypothetical protein [Candidatus Saccharimonadales bacterium]
MSRRILQATRQGASGRTNRRGARSIIVNVFDYRSVCIMSHQSIEE